MYNLILADLYKIRKSTVIKVLFAISILSSVAMVMIAYMITQGKLANNMTGVGFLFSDIDIMSILGGVIAGIFICGDFDNKIIHDAIANGCSRSVVIVSKAVVFFCSIVFVLIPYAIITGIALGTGSKFNMGSVAMGFLHVITSDGGKTFSAGDIGKLLLVMLTLMIVYAAQLSICILIAILSKRSVVVIAAYYAISIISGQLGALKNSSKVFDHIFACTPFGGNYGLLSLNSGIGDILKAILVSLIFIVVILAITSFAFRKSEIK